jgi:hypothetical protein
MLGITLKKAVTSSEHQSVSARPHSMPEVSHLQPQISLPSNVYVHACVVNVLTHSVSNVWPYPQKHYILLAKCPLNSY